MQTTIIKSRANADTYVRARIDTQTKERATAALESMGLSVSDAIRLLMIKIADEHRLPFTIKAPNSTTKAAIAELELGNSQKFDSINELIHELTKEN